MATETILDRDAGPTTAPKVVDRDDCQQHLETPEQCGLVRDGKDVEGPVDALFTKGNMPTRPLKHVL